MLRPVALKCLLAVSLGLGTAHAADQKKQMPKEDVVEVPAIGEGLCLSNFFQTNMVLQRDKPLAVWGWAAPGEEITVSFAGQQFRAKAAADRSWRGTLEPMSASSTPQTMTVKGKDRTLTLENILVGDIWILGGQSNMEFAISKVIDGELEMVSANFPQLRLLTMPQGKGFDSVGSFERMHEWSSWSGRHFRKGDWDVCSPETVRDFSAIGYVFGRRLAMAGGVPIGLVDASVGGTTVETWTPEDVMRKIEGRETKDKLAVWKEKIASYDPQADLQKQIANYERKKQKLTEQGKALPADSKPPSELRPGPVADKNRPGYCYASMIRPLEGLSVKGALFHQGFNNAFGGSAGARMYYQVFGKMITAWRSTFGDPQMPFCIISLCTAGDPQTLENFLPPMYDAGVLLREAQYKTFRDFRDAGDEQIGFVSSFDQRKSWYHPQIKVPVGERAAKWALVTQYEVLGGRDADDYWLPPSVEQAEVVDGTIKLTMSTNIATRDESDGRMLGFAIAGKDRLFHPADVNWFTDGTKDNRNRPVYDKTTLVLSSPFVSKPVHYRHAWARNPMSNITNARQVPLATQRSDDWILEETPVKFPTLNMTQDAANRQLKGKLRKELELADTERRIKEAERTLAELKEPYEKARADWEEKKAAEAEKAKAGAK